jgi:predicted  nucleic acid-binding Zn-ribbon protein
MLKGLFAALVGAAASLSVLQSGPDGATGSLEASGGAASAPSQVSSPARDGGLGVWIPSDGGPIYLGERPGSILRPEEEAPARESVNPAGAEPPDSGPGPDGMAQLSSRVAALEQQLEQARANSQTEQLWQLNGQVAALRGQLAQGQARREAEAVRKQQARQLTQEAVTALSDAQYQLALGNSQVLYTLESASRVLPFPAQEAVQYAREAVEREDLAEARYWLSVAISEVQRAQLSH